MRTAEPLRPALWERYLVSDEELGAGYEEAEDAEKARIKLCLARLHALYGDSVQGAQTRRDFRQGFFWEEKISPAPFALIVCEADYPHAVRFSAALCPAILSGVETVLPLFVQGVEGERPSAPLLAALELAGAEGGAAAPENAVLPFLEELDAAAPGGRVVVVGRPGFCEQLLPAALRMRFRAMFLTRLPVPLSAEEGTAFQGAAFRISLDKEHEGLWLWPHLDPHWFCNRSAALGAVAE